MKDDRVYLFHMRDCITRIEAYTLDGKQAFLNDSKTQDAVLRNLHTLAESTQQLSQDLRAKYPQIAWRAISAFRNVVVHNYLGVDLVRIWDIVEQDLPVLRGQLESIIGEENV